MDKVQHFEIPADDLARARKFYEESFGWQTASFPMAGMEYVGLHTGPVDAQNMTLEKGFINGGMFKRGGDFLIVSPTVAVVTADIEACLAKVTQAGGEIVMPKTKVGEMGLYAYVKDTEGNIIGVWQDVSMMKTE